MNININGMAWICQQDTLTVSQLLQIKGISTQGTAVAVNGRLCKSDTWDSTYIKEADEVSIISAAFGG